MDPSLGPVNFAGPTQDVLYDPFDVVEPENPGIQSFQSVENVVEMSPVHLLPPLLDIEPDNDVASTDNLLNISPSKRTLLGKDQAKRRLLAFSSFKQMTLSPISRKLNKEKDEEKEDENGTKPESKLTKRQFRKSNLQHEANNIINYCTCHFRCSTC